MSTVTVEGMGTFTYTAIVDNKSNYGTLTFTLNSFEILTPSKYKRKKGYWAGIKIDGKNFVGHTAEKVPSVKQIKSTSKGVSVSSGQLGVIDDDTIYVDNSNDYKFWKKETSKTLQNHLWANLVILKDKIDKKTQQNKNNKEIKVTGNQRSISITFQIYGYIETVSFNVGGTSTSSGSDASAKEEGVEYTSITSVNNGIPYLIKQDAYKVYGWIERVVDFNDIDDPTVLKRVGQLYLDNLQFDEMSIEVTALDLHYIDNTIQRLDLLDSVRCISKPHGLDKVFPITKVTIPLDHPDQVKYTLGTNQAGGGGISASSSNDAKKFMKSLESFPTKAYTLDVAKAQTSTILNQRTTGYVTIVDRSENGQTHSEAIIISSGTDWTTSQRIWKWDMNGLGYSDKKISKMSQNEKNSMQTLTDAGKAVRVNDDDRWYKLGITNDGTIVADVIKTGVLSDAAGRNFWDLTNGSFSLSYRSDLVLPSGDKKTIGDVYTLADTASSDASEAIEVSDNALASSITATNTANSALTTANMANSKQVSSKNLLSASNSASSWSLYSKDVSPANSYGSFSGLNNTSDVPEVGIKQIIRIDTKNLTNGRVGIKRSNVQVLLNTTYTFSCYVKKTDNTVNKNSVILIVGSTYTDNNKNMDGHVYSTSSNVSKEWTKYSLVFKTTTKDRIIENETKTKKRATTVASQKGHSIDVAILISGKYSTCNISGIMLVKGNSSGSWSPSVEDTYDDLATYVDAISDRDREFSKEQREALDASLDQKKILTKLTRNANGTVSNGIYLYNNQLLINGSYIKSGTIDAGIVKAGILSDQRQNNVWNLANGYFKTKNIEVTNGNVKGTFTTGTKRSSLIKLSQGELLGYQGGKLVGWLNATGGVTDEKSGKFTKGLIIGAPMIRFEAGFFTVTTKHKHNNSATSHQMFTGSIPIVNSIRDRGNGSISWNYSYLHVINGLIVAYNSSKKVLK